MEQTLKIKDFIDFDEIFARMKSEIYESNTKGNLVSEHLV